jgi:hypothetical protein
MSVNLGFDGGSPFRIKRPLITTSGFVSDVDATVKAHLDELNQLLGKQVFSRPGQPPAPLAGRVASNSGARGRSRGGAHAAHAAAGAPAHAAAAVLPNPNVGLDVQTVLALDLFPKIVPPDANNLSWPRGSLAQVLSDAKELPANLTLGDHIDMTPELSSLKYDFEGNLSLNWSNLDYNTKSVLDSYPSIRDYLVAYGYHVMQLTEINGLRNFIFSNRQGAKNVIDYTIVSAARTVVDSEKLTVPKINDDQSDIVGQIKAAGLSLSTASFRQSLQAVIDNYVFNFNEEQLIDNSKIGPVPAAIKPTLIKYIKNSPVPITAANVDYFLPLFITQIMGQTQVDTPTEVDTAESDKDFNVEFLVDDNSLVVISQSAVRCASQLYYGMILGDELRVFEMMSHFTHKYLVRGNINIEDSRLRDDLQLYVFSGKFTDPKSGRIADRSRPSERKMFYRQVFDYGHAPITPDVIVNREFNRLWKVLMVESATYLERAQASPNPDSFVSRQKVSQAVEDLQYNLSTHCTGMANVISPLIYAELNFIVQRVLMHPEILRQVVPAGGTWWRVVEVLYLDMKHSRPKSTVIYNKAKLGSLIIRSIAEYNPATFESDASFSDFISNVDAYITTQSILQEALTDDLKEQGASGDPDDEYGEKHTMMPPASGPHPEPIGAGAPAASANGSGGGGAGSGTGGGDWDF